MYTGYSEYGVYAGGVHSTLDTVNMECTVESTVHLDTVNMECMLVESAVHWIQCIQCTVDSTNIHSIFTVSSVLWSPPAYTGYSEYSVSVCSLWSLQYIGYSEFTESVCCGVHQYTLDTVNTECMLWSPPVHSIFSEYGVYAVESTSTLDTVYGVYAVESTSTLDTVNMECMLVESTVHWIQ